MSIPVRLGIMMFLQFFVWGAWYVSMTGFINAEEMVGLTGAAYTVAPIAAIIAPLFLGMVADRYFATQKVLGVLHLIGGALLIATPMVASTFMLDPAPEGSSLFYQVMLHDRAAYVQPFILLLLAHMLCYMPTLALSTSLSLANLDDGERQFPWVRVLGTIGWIVGNLAVGLQLYGGKSLEDSAGQFYLAGGAALLLGLYSFTLPHTPPPAAGQQTSLGQTLGLDSLRMMKNPSYAVFIIASLLICIPLAGYYQQGRNFVDAVGVEIGGSGTTTMSLGQMSEVVFMLLMPWFFVRLGVKWMLTIGMGAWVLRYGLFAAGAPESVTWMIILGILLHGVCYDFFFVTGMIYADKKAPATVKNQAQSFLVLVTQGIGLGLGAKIFFAHALLQTTPAATEEGAAIVDWQTVWLYPCIFAGVVMVAFFALFWDRTDRTITEEEVAADTGEGPAV